MAGHVSWGCGGGAARAALPHVRTQARGSGRRCTRPTAQPRAPIRKPGLTVRGVTRRKSNFIRKKRGAPAPLFLRKHPREHCAPAHKRARKQNGCCLGRTPQVAKQTSRPVPGILFGKVVRILENPSQNNIHFCFISLAGRKIRSHRRRPSIFDAFPPDREGQRPANSPHCTKEILSEKVL